MLIGGGPACLGFLCNAKKQQKLENLIKSGDGIAIIEKGTALGGGNLQNYIINSNTSADGFLACLQSAKGMTRSGSAEKLKAEEMMESKKKRASTKSPRKNGIVEPHNEIEQECKKDRLEIIIQNVQRPLPCFAKL